MKKCLLIILGIVFSINVFSQITFEKGYYIDNSGKKIECLIKYIDWRNNPTEFEYKQNESSDLKEATIENVKEFGVYGKSKYIREDVGIDRASENINKLSYEKNVEFQEERLFLKVLVEGGASLYSYVDGTLTRFFFNVGDSAIKQLVYKQYLTPENKVGENNRFRQQLWSNLRCSSLPINRFEDIEYKRKPMMRLFVQYNECKNNEFMVFEKKKEGNSFHLSLRPGVNFSTPTLSNEYAGYRNAEFKEGVGYRFGIEAEFILPFYNDKWSFIVEPTYQSFKSEDKTSSIIGRIDYQSIELPIGLRHYLFLNKKSKAFINASLIIDFAFDSKITNELKHSSDYEITTGQNLGFGLGYLHNDRYSIEVRYLTNRDLLSKHSYWTMDNRIFSVILGYKLF